jgi:hypothetical protein
MSQHATTDAIPFETELPPLRRRLVELRREWETGQRRLAVLDAQRQETRDTLLRIVGAIQVIEETLNEAAADRAAPRPASPP